MQCAIRRGATHAPAALAAIAAALLVGACSQGEPQSVKARPNAPLASTRSSVPGEPGASPVDEGLKERLARQEAASKLFEKVEPAPAKAAPPATVAVSPPAAIASPPAAPASAPKAIEPAARAALAEPPKAAAPEPARTTAASTPPPPAPEPAKEAPKAPRVDLAVAKPAAAPSPASLAARLVSRVDPDFPREAVQAGVDRGVVRARMTLDNAGNVTRVEVVDASPRRIFDRAVTRALSQWRFSEGPSGRTVETEVEFRR
jgi:protein TonB